jgi:hypothetical protein
MSDTKPLADAPAQQAAVDKTITNRQARAVSEAQFDARRKAADDAADAAEDSKAPLTQEQKDAEAHDKAEADAAAKAEEAKAARAKAGVTAAANGDPAMVAFGARIDAAKFEHRNQGHDDTMQLLDDMLAGIQRLEAQAAG